MDKLWNSIKEGHDSKNRIVFICKDDNGFFVSKPQNGFKSKYWPIDDDSELIACFERQCSCGHSNPFYEAHEVEAVTERPAKKANIKKK
jgi:hypothetical protein